MHKLNLLIDAYENNFEKILKEKYSHLSKKKYTPNYLLLGVHKQNILDKDFLFDLQFRIEEAKKYGYTNKNIKIAVLDKAQPYSQEEWKRIKEVEQKLKKDNIYLGFFDEDSIYDVDLAKRVIEKIENIAKKINSLNLSPFEKIMLAYNITQRRVYTSESKIDGKDKSRSIYSVLTNEEIVCVGYANIFKFLLEFVKDDNLKAISNLVATVTKDNYSNGYHMNNIAYIKDDKYGINGVYYFDPTWDCIKKKDDNMFRMAYFMLPISDLDYMKYVNIMDGFLKVYPKKRYEEQKKSYGSFYLSKRKEKIKIKNFANQLLDAYISDVKDYNTICQKNSISKDGLRILDIEFISKLLNDSIFSNIAYSLKEQTKTFNNIDINIQKVRDKMENLDILEELFKEYNIDKIRKSEYKLLLGDRKDNPSVYQVVKSIIDYHLNPDFEYTDKDDLIDVKTVIKNLKVYYTYQNNKLDNTSTMNIVNMEKGLRDIGLDYSTIQKAILYFSTPIKLSKIKSALTTIYEKTTKLSKEEIDDTVNKIINHNKLNAFNRYDYGAKNPLFVENYKLDMEL